MNLHTSEDAFNHQVDMPSKLVEQNIIAKLECNVLRFSLACRPKMLHPGVNKIALPLYIIVCPLQYFQGMLCNDIANYIKK